MSISLTMRAVAPADASVLVASATQVNRVGGLRSGAGVDGSLA
jgi:hypothetical protein